MAKKRSTVPKRYADRITRVRAEMERRHVDGYLVVNRNDQYWLTGFTGEDGGVLVSARAVVLLTDGRFSEAADREAPFAHKVLRKLRSPAETAAEVKRCKIQRLGYDPGHMNVGDFTALRRLARPAALVAASGIILGMRKQKDAGEVAVIRQAIDVAQRAFKKTVNWIRAGQTEREIAAKLEYEMARLGATGPSFPTIVAVGRNASLPHCVPGERVVSEREGILIDWGARVDWYCSDLTRMVWPGSIPRRLAKIYGIVHEAKERATAAIRPGIKAADIDRIARDHIRKSGYGKNFNHSLGHGMGLDIHEAPIMRKVCPDVLQPGMIVTVEPGVYIPAYGGIRIEDDVLVTETGHEVLSSLPTDLPR